MAKYKVLSPIKFKGKRRPIGDVVEMTEEDAEQPLAAKVIEATKAEEPKK